MLLKHAPQALSAKKALLYCAFWMIVALIFNLGLWWWRGPSDALNFLTCYLIEYSLSIDNLFVFSIIFKEFAVPPHQTHRVLFFGIAGAIVLRILLILGGITIVEKFHWILYVFGAFLILTGWELLRKKEKDVPNNRLMRWIRSIIPTTDHYVKDNFFTKQKGRWVATPLFIVLVLIELADVIFAIDSIPAALGITRDPLIVFSANFFAILGLRSLYFSLAALIDWFRYLRYGLGVILIFVGLKMVIEPWLIIPVGASLGFIALIILACIILSKYRQKTKKTQP